MGYADSAFIPYSDEHCLSSIVGPIAHNMFGTTVGTVTRSTLHLMAPPGAHAAKITLHASTTSGAPPFAIYYDNVVWHR